MPYSPTVASWTHCLPPGAPSSLFVCPHLTGDVTFGQTEAWDPQWMGCGVDSCGIERLLLAAGKLRKSESRWESFVFASTLLPCKVKHRVDRCCHSRPYVPTASLQWVLCSMLNGSRFEYAVLSLDDLKSPLFVRLYSEAVLNGILAQLRLLSSCIETWNKHQHSQST